MKIKYGMCLVAVVASILLAAAGAWAQTQPTRWQTNPIAAGQEHTCELLANGTVKCCGKNDFGQLGDGTKRDRTTPVAVELGSSARAVAITAGGYHTCALLANGKVWCWGLNSSGQLGNGGSASTVALPLVVSGVSNAVTITAGYNHSCAALADGGAECWGSNYYGQLGNPNVTSLSLTPVVVSAPLVGSVAGIAAGGNHTCALPANGTVWCWGRNDYGQLGDGTMIDKDSPTFVQLY